MKRILILGDSHTRAISKACKLRAENGSVPRDVEFSVNWLMTQKAEKVRGNLSMEEALKQVSSLGPDDIVVISVLGTAHNVLGFLKHEQPFDIYCSAEKAIIQDDVMMIPENALWDTFQSKIERNKNIREIRETAACTVIHLSTPPPKDDNRFILERVKGKVYRGRIIAETDISSPIIRLKLWDLEMRVLSNICNDREINFLAAPQEAIGALGFLKPEYYGNDAAHANAAYGELVLKQLESLII